jgi:rubrerythrin
MGFIEAIDLAMAAEIKARDFYTSALEKVTHARGKDLLSQLADFEQQHYDKLNELKTSLSEREEYISYEGTSFRSYRESAPSEVSGPMEPDKDALLDILSMAIDAETKANERYLTMSEQTTDPRGKDMFKKLAEEEVLHRRILSDEYYHMSNQSGMWIWGE